MLWSCSIAPGSPKVQDVVPLQHPQGLPWEQTKLKPSPGPSAASTQAKDYSLHITNQEDPGPQCADADKPRPPNPNIPHFFSITSQLPTLILSHFKHVLFYMQ